jgi:hypothetical protein
MQKLESLMGKCDPIVALIVGLLVCNYIREGNGREKQ